MALPNRNPRPIAQVEPQSVMAESYRTIRTNLQFASVADEEVRVILVTSTGPAEGKTSTVTNLAVVAAETGKRVLLLDADLRRPQVHHHFQISNLSGLTTVLIGEKTLEECTQTTATTGLFVLPSGPIPPNPSQILSSHVFQNIVKTLRDQFDLIFLDTPPVLAATDAMLLTQVCDGVVFVVDAKKTNRAQAHKAVQMLEQTNTRMLGVVLNRVDRKSAQGRSYYEYYQKVEHAPAE